jgi:hypothetical protein
MAPAGSLMRVAYMERGWAGAGTVRLCDADEREARTFARTLRPYPRTLVSRASHMSAAAFCL